MKRLDGKVALITGGASGLGKAMAERLLADGATVIITDLQTDLGDATAKEGGFTFIEQDVCDEAQWTRIIATVEERFGRLDVLVNNAGIVGPRDAVNPENSRLEDWRRIFTVNVDSVMLSCRAAIPAMRRTGSGSIINISSVAALCATPYAMAYGASKATVRHITKSVAQHCAAEGLKVRCNSVHPGNIYTPMWEKIAAEMARARNLGVEDILKEIGARNPLGGFTLAEDVAAVVAFLASDDSSRMTGDKFLVDGGSINCDTFHLSQRFKDVILESAAQQNKAA